MRPMGNIVFRAVGHAKLNEKMSHYKTEIIITNDQHINLHGRQMSLCSLVKILEGQGKKIFPKMSNYTFN